MKVGMIRCMQTEDMCPATTCFKVMKEKKLAFNNVTEDIEVIGVNTCGECQRYAHWVSMSTCPGNEGCD
ncbi:MAG: Protein of unknown function region [Anaerocolumna sp.]|nr:Protein of unknown function region [Anaerocolumna sp.]